MCGLYSLITINLFGFLKLEKKNLCMFGRFWRWIKCFIDTIFPRLSHSRKLMFSSNELMVVRGSRWTKLPGRGEDIRYFPNPDTLLYDWSKFIVIVRKLIQVISIPCISLNVRTVGFESFLLVYYMNCSYFAVTIQWAIFLENVSPILLARLESSSQAPVNKNTHTKEPPTPI